MTKKEIIAHILMLESQLWSEIQFDKAHKMPREVLDQDRTKWYTIYNLIEILELDKEIKRKGVER